MVWKHALTGGMALLLLATIAAPPATACAVATRAAAKALVLKAAGHLAQHGRATAFRDFVRPGGGFLSGDLYLWVIDLDGVLLLNARYPRYVGSNLAGGPESLGHAVLQRAKRTGSGWVEYRWYSPCSGRVENKVAFFKRVGGLIVGAGAYPKPGV